MRALLVFLSCLPLAWPARAGMDGPVSAPADAPWACQVYWTHIQVSDVGNTEYTTTQTGIGSGFLLEPWVVVTVRHLVPSFFPSEGLTVRCGDQTSSGRIWSWLDPANDVAAISYGGQPIVTASPNDLAVIYLQAPFAVDAASIPRLPRDGAQVQAAVRGGQCSAWGWATGDLRSHPVTPIENKRGLPGDPKVGPSAWHSDPTHVLEYPNPASEGDSGGPVICRASGGGDILAGLVQGVSPNRAVAIYQRVDPYLSFLCEKDPDYCKTNAIGDKPALDPAKTAAALVGARASAAELTGR